MAVELAVGVSLAAGLALAGTAGVRELRGRWAHAGRAPAAPAERVEIRWPERPSLGPVRRALGLFRGVADDQLLAPLRTGEIDRVAFNLGGSSISLRIDFDNGARAAFKPRQTNWQTVPRREVAAYRINRLLGLSTVAPAIGRMFRVDDILSHLEPDSAYIAPRLRAEMIQNDGWVVGELSWWIPRIAKPRIDGYPVDSVDGVVTWHRYLTIGEPVPYREARLVAQISDMVVFDFLINNLDRWSGGNVRSSPDGSFLYYMDNTLSFGRQPAGAEKVRSYLMKVQKFSRSLVAALRALDEEAVRAALADDPGPFHELLDDSEVAALMARRDYALRYIDDLIARHGADNVLVFP
ncbi:MAG: hypothetical protein D6689_01480 [Deltaproteobacteria bacterium]|nr:MAG: hypothetical protein D6689_01480 [Deltaproteobacteria bacterium]